MRKLKGPAKNVKKSTKSTKKWSTRSRNKKKPIEQYDHKGIMILLTINGKVSGNE